MLSHWRSPVWAVVAGICFILILVEGCIAFGSMSQPVEPANSAACHIFANAYNAMITDANNQDYAAFGQDEKRLQLQMDVAFSKADGAVATSLNSALADTQPYLNGDSSNNAVDLFAMSMADVSKSCSNAGVPLTIESWQAH